MSTPSKKRTKYLTVCAMLSALGVVFLGLGSLIESIDLTCAALASILCIYAVIEIGGAYPWMIWAVTSLLSLILLPQKSPAAFYLFIGFYPILKARLEKLPRIVCIILKLVIFHAIIVLSWLVIRIFFPADAQFQLGWILLSGYALCLVVFLLYDYCLTLLVTVYLRRWRKRLGLK